MEILVDKTIFVFQVLFPFSICNAKKLQKIKEYVHCHQ